MDRQMDGHTDKQMNSPNWARELSKGIVDVDSLVRRGVVEKADKELLRRAKENFDIRVPATFVKSMESDFSIAAQFVPNVAELQELQQELTDPIGDERWTPLPGLTHRYPDRVLVKLTYQCASYCRFCFRRYKVSNSAENLKTDELHDLVRYIASKKEIFEVILTGGDPMVLTEQRLVPFMQELANIPHVKVLRIHSRVLTVLPERITKSLIETLQVSQKSLWWVAHINCESELSEKAVAAANLLKAHNINLISQTVLLKGINASSDGLQKLFRALIILGIKPYYLHYPDLAKGTNHFRVPLKEAIHLFSTLRGALSGIAIPQFILDIPGGMGKISIEPNRAVQVSDSVWEFTSPLTNETVQIEYPQVESPPVQMPNTQA